MNWIKRGVALVVATVVSVAALLGVAEVGGGRPINPPTLTLKSSVASAAPGVQFTVAVESPAETVRLTLTGPAYVYRDTGGRAAAVTPKEPGNVTVTAVAVRADGSASDLKTLTVPVAGDVPGPPGPPEPKPPTPPEPKPAPPVPPEPAADQALVKAFREAFEADVAANLGLKTNVAALAEVFTVSAGLIELGDPAIAPKTYGDVYTKTFAASVAKGVPRLPYLGALRKAVDAALGRYPGDKTLTDELKTELAAKYRKVGAALAEVSK